MLEEIKILGVKVNNVDLEESYLRTKELIETSNKSCKMIFAPNTEFIMCAQKDKDFFEILNKSDLSTPDSVGVEMAAKKLNKPLKQRIQGQKYFRKIVQEGEKLGWSFYILGGKGDTPKVATDNLKKIFPKLNVIGLHEGYFENEEKELEVIEEINRLKPNVLIVAMGAPKQEKWIYKYKDKLKVDVACGQGGTLDYEAGNIKRAPEFFQKVGLEWFWRLIKQPSRIVRMMVLPVYLFKILFTKDITKGKFDSKE